MTAHVARKGEPEEKPVSPTKATSNTSSQANNYMQQNTINYASAFPKVTTPRTPAAAIEDNNFKIL